MVLLAIFAFVTALFAMVVATPPMFVTSPVRSVLVIEVAPENFDRLPLAGEPVVETVPLPPVVADMTPFFRRDPELSNTLRERVARPGAAGSYLAEARILARLDHPHIVPVHDVGQTDDGLPFVVSKFIEGTDMAETIRHARPSSAAAPDLVATVAEALHHAHLRGWSTATSSRPTFSSTPPASPTWPTSGWPCGRRTPAGGPAFLGRPPT